MEKISPSNYFPLTCLTHGSLLRSPIKTELLANYNHFLPLTDIGNISQSVIYWDAMVKANKKPVLGVQLEVCERGEFDIHCGTVILLCKNKSGWLELLKILHKANNPDTFIGHPSLTINDIITFNLDNLIVIGCNLGIPMTKVLSKYARHFYLGINPYDKWTKISGYNEVPITTNACFSKEEYSALEVLRKKENKKNTIEQPSYIHSREELENLGFESSHFNNTLEIFNQVEQFEIKNKQVLPQLRTSRSMRELCLEGLQNKQLLKPNYIERLNHELGVIQKAGMEGYFLVVASITEFLRKKNRLMGTSRGSCGGSLISYTLGITDLDPIPYDLMFERFYNADRGGLPDIDIDIPPDSRDSVFQHVQSLYGIDNFAQLCTFGTLKGAAAIKLCLSVNNVNFLEQNEITKQLPKEHKIAPQLKDQLKQVGHESLVYWALKNMPKKLARWCTLDSKGNLEGKYAKEFELAIQLDGIIDSRGRHASAFALSDEPLYNKAPMAYDDKSNEYIVGVEMNSAESLGLIKIDLLGLDLLSKAEYMREVLHNGSICKSKNW